MYESNDELFQFLLYYSLYNSPREGNVLDAAHLHKALAQ